MQMPPHIPCSLAPAICKTPWWAYDEYTQWGGMDHLLFCSLMSHSISQLMMVNLTITIMGGLIWCPFILYYDNLYFPCQQNCRHSTECWFVERLAKLLHNIAASAAIPHGQAACRGHELTPAPPTSAGPRYQSRES